MQGPEGSRPPPAKDDCSCLKPLLHPQRQIKPKPVAIAAPAFEMPKFEMPKFEMPKFEVPPAFREFAEKGIAQAKENYEKCQECGRAGHRCPRGHLFHGLQGLCELRPQGDRDHARQQRCRLRSDERADEREVLCRRWSNSPAHFMRKQFDALIAQAKELSEHAQKVATETAEPIRKASAARSIRRPDLYDVSAWN